MNEWRCTSFPRYFTKTIVTWAVKILAPAIEVIYSSQMSNDKNILKKKNI